MKTRHSGMALLLLSAVWAVPAAADSPKGAVGMSHQGYTDDISRAMHEQRMSNRERGIVAPVTGSQYRGMRTPVTAPRASQSSDSSTYWLREAARVHDTIIAWNSGSTRNLAQLEGTPVTDSRGNHLGTIIRVNEKARLAQLYMGDEGKSIALPVNLLTPKGDFAQAMTVSKADALAMARTQHRTYVAMAR